MKRSYYVGGGLALVALLGYLLIFRRSSSSSSAAPVAGAPADNAGGGVHSFGVPEPGTPADFTPVGSTPKSVPNTSSSSATPTTTTTATDAAPVQSLRDRLLSSKGWDFNSYTIRGWAFVPTRSGWIGQPAHSLPGSTYTGDAQGSAPTTEEWTAFIRTGASQGWADKLVNLIPKGNLLSGEEQYLPPELLGSPSKA